MGLLSRISFVVRSWINALLGRTYDPAAELDYSYEQLRDELQEVNRGIADLTTQKKRLEIHRERLRENVDKHDGQVREALRQDREDLARRALEKKQATADQIVDMTEQIDQLQATQDRLLTRQGELRSSIEQFRTRKETMKARYEAAQASARVSEAFSGVGGEMEDVSRAIERATERTEKMEARASALEELEATGALDNVLDEGDDIDAELERVSSERRVEQELEGIKAELGKDSDAVTTVEVEEEIESEPEAEAESEETGPEATR